MPHELRKYFDVFAQLQCKYLHLNEDCGLTTFFCPIKYKLDKMYALIYTSLRAYLDKMLTGQHNRLSILLSESCCLSQLNSLAE